VSQNPFFENWSTPFGMPPFDQIKVEHFQPAYDKALPLHVAEIAAIRDNPAPATFDNTIVAFEKAGGALLKINKVFWNLTGTESDEALQKIER
jgi:peptidyl-dipeptidase Dcp